MCIIQVEEDDMDAHGYRKEIKNDEAWFERQYAAFEQKYMLPQKAADK